MGQQGTSAMSLDSKTGWNLKLHSNFGNAKLSAKQRGDVLMSGCFQSRVRYVSVVVPCCPPRDVQEVAGLLQVVSCVHPAQSELIAR